MLTTRLPLVPGPPDDDHIVQLLRSVTRSFVPDKAVRRIALVGDDGRPYRLIVATGELEFDTLVDTLFALRFVPAQIPPGVDVALERLIDGSA